MIQSDNPYSPPHSPPSTFGEDNDKAVANGCAVASIAMFGFGVLSIGYAALIWLRFHFDTAEGFPGRPDADLHDGLCIFLFGASWSGSGVLAYRMEHVPSILLFIAGVLMLLFIATYR